MGEGDIGTVIDTLTFESTDFDQPDFIHVTGDIFACCYRGPDLDGFIKTFSIDSAGNIGGAAIDTLEFNTVTGYYPKILHVSGTVYAIIHTGVDLDGWCFTITIDAAGNISAGIVDSLEYDTAKSFPQDFIHISLNIYAAAYSANLVAGKCATWEILSDGSMDVAVIDKTTSLPATVNQPAIINTAGLIYAIAYQAAGSVGQVLTLQIGNDGNIVDSVIDTFEFDSVNCENPRMIKISATVFAVVYTGPDFDGWLKTFTVDAAGNIGAAAIDSFEFATVQGLYPQILHVSGDAYVIAYTGADADGFIQTVTIDAAGNIGAAAIDTYEFQTVKAEKIHILFVTASVYAVVYMDTNDYGVVSTLGIETLLPAVARHDLLMGIG